MRVIRIEEARKLMAAGAELHVFEGNGYKNCEIRKPVAPPAERVIYGSLDGRSFTRMLAAGELAEKSKDTARWMTVYVTSEKGTP